MFSMNILIGNQVAIEDLRGDLLNRPLSGHTKLSLGRWSVYSFVYSHHFYLLRLHWRNIVGGYTVSLQVGKQSNKLANIWLFF